MFLLICNGIEGVWVVRIEVDIGDIGIFVDIENFWLGGFVVGCFVEILVIVWWL